MAHEAENVSINLAAPHLFRQSYAMQTQQPQISRHAIERYQQRVSSIESAEAARRLAALAVDSTRRPTPRHWTNVLSTPGVLFAYPHAAPAICLLMRGDIVITVFCRDVCRMWQRTQKRAGAQRVPYRRPGPGSFPLEAA
jgi:hypothetical protein